MAYLLEVDDLHTFFKTKKGIVKAVNGVSYRVEPGKHKKFPLNSASNVTNL